VVLRPLFRGFVFVKIEPENPRWRTVSLTYGIRSIVRSGNNYGLLPDTFVAALRAREIEGAITRPVSPYKVGQTVALTSGLFDGIVATIVEMAERDRLVVLINLLNGQVKVKVDSSQVREVAQPG
jgi:transcriptional antiterminator RfaH